MDVDVMEANPSGRPWGVCPGRPLHHVQSAEFAQQRAEAVLSADKTACNGKAPRAAAGQQTAWVAGDATLLTPTIDGAQVTSCRVDAEAMGETEKSERRTRRPREGCAPGLAVDAPQLNGTLRLVR